MIRVGMVAVGLGVAASAGCASYQPPGASGVALPLPSDIQRYYQCPSGDVTPAVRATEVYPEYTLKQITLSSAGAAEPIRIDWFAPNTFGAGLRTGLVPRSPLIVISPIRGSDTFVVEGLARIFASCGYQAAVVKRARAHFDPGGPLTQIEDSLRDNVIRHRQALDWLVQQPSVDPDRVGAFGISYGAIITSVLAAVDPRVKACVLDLAGGPLAGVLRTSAEPGLRRYWNRCRRRHLLTDKQLYESMANVIRTDPVKLAPYLPRDHVLMLIARFDSSVPTRYQVRLWRALGKPRADFVLLGHYTSILALPAHRLSAMRFFEENLEPKPSVPAAISVQARN
jgi:hypothetical protein